MQKAIRNLMVVALWVLSLGISARALDPNQPATSFLRTHFSTDDGLPGGVVDQIVQTRDGFLWLITGGSNLVRFDGKSFYIVAHAHTLAVAPNGDLWLGWNDGLTLLPSSNFNQFTFTGLVSYHPGPGKASDIKCLRFSRSGVLWIGTEDGLFRYEGDQFVPVGPRVGTRQIEEAPDGHMLVTTGEGFIEFADSEIVPHPRLAARLGVKDNEIFGVLKDSHGNIWYLTAKGIVRETNGRVEKMGGYGSRSRPELRIYEDAQGTVWVGNGEGLFRATSSGLELVAGAMQVRSIYGDRDGTLWVGTNGDGLHLFKNRAIRMYTTDDGLPNILIQTVMVAHDGAIWTGANCGGISRFDGTHFQTYNEKDGLLNSCVWAIAEDASHDLWIGTWGGGAFRYHDGSFTQFSKSQGVIDDRVTSIVAARDGTIWFGTRGGVTRLKDGQLRNFTTDDGLSLNTILSMFEDRAGVIWVGSRKGIDRLVGDRFENFSSAPKSLAYLLGEDREGGFFVELQDGPVTLRFNKTRVENISDLPAVDMVETDQGELWFGGNAITRVPAGSLIRPRQHDEPIDYEAFSRLDGLATARVTGPARSLALTRDGKLWVATPKGLAMFDLRRLPITNARTSIYLTDLTIGRKTQPASGEIVLPPGTSHLQIDFSAVEISSPEKIRMQYRLDGVDSEWLDAGPNPHAIYSTIPVGKHVLHIRACNRNGIWDRQGMVFSITQQPFFYQTRWFAVAMIALGILLLALIYRLRVRQISRSMSARFDVRLAERVRVARELHDTLLQTVQGSKLVADHALKDTADHARMVRALERLSTWLEQATEEGRAALNSLRTSTVEKNNLAEGFRRAIDECRRGRSIETSFSVKGIYREMHPIVRDEIYRIGFEAIRNACAHSEGDSLEVTLEYAHDLTLRISDNGVGIDSEIVEKGKEGHFGLRGMRERAECIGSALSLISSPGSGSVITLVVPGRIIFQSAYPGRLKSFFSRN